jgi:uncharacterized ferritin-like protein (DUF455 family)
MNLKDYAEQILFTDSVEKKLFRPDTFTDNNLSEFRTEVKVPVRPKKLQFSNRQNATSKFPKTTELEKPEAVARVMHYLANHELLALEIMALVLLKFPDAPKAFRMGLAREMLEEQEHMEQYLNRMNQLGMEFGEVPVNNFFWRMLKDIKHPIEFCSKMALTFEQANLDFSKYFINEFEKTGDKATVDLLTKVYEDEIGHVGFGLHWFKKWSGNPDDLFEAHKDSLVFPLGLQRAKADRKLYDEEARRKAGFDESYIEKLKYFSSSKERPAVLRYFNPEIEDKLLKKQKNYQPKKIMKNMKMSLEHIPWIFSLAQDVVVVSKKPSKFFLDQFLKLGWQYPEYVVCQSKSEMEKLLKSRTWASVAPWALEPENLKLKDDKNIDILNRSNLELTEEQLIQMHSSQFSCSLFREFVSKHDKYSNILASSNEWPTSFNETETAISFCKQWKNVVVKAPLGLSGRGVFFLNTKEESTLRKTLDSIINTQSFVVCEPYHERVFDFSLQLKYQQESKSYQWGIARFFSSESGAYAGGYVGKSLFSDLTKEQKIFWNNTRDDINVQNLLQDLKEFLELKFKKMNYLSSAGIDCFVYQEKGKLKIRPLVEINARHNMGFLKWQLSNKIKTGQRAKFEILHKNQIANVDFSKELQSLHSVRGQMSSGTMYLSDPYSDGDFVARLCIE